MKRFLLSLFTAYQVGNHAPDTTRTGSGAESTADAALIVHAIFHPAIGIFVTRDGLLFANMGADLAVSACAA